MTAQTEEIEKLLSDRLEVVRTERASTREAFIALDTKIKAMKKAMGPPPRDSLEFFSNQIANLEREHGRTSRSNAEERTFMYEMDKLKKQKASIAGYTKQHAEVETLMVTLNSLRNTLLEKETAMEELVAGLKKVKIASKVHIANHEVMEKIYRVSDIAQALAASHNTQLSAEQLEEDIDACIGKIIGRNGSTLQHIESTFNVDVAVNNADRTVTILGAMNDILRAYEYIFLQCDTTSLDLPVTEECISYLTNNKFNLLNELSDKHGIKIDVFNAKNHLKLVGLTAPVQAAAQDLRIINKHIFRGDMMLEPSYIAFVIGKQGSTIRAIESTHQVLCKIDKEQELVVVVGMKQNVQSAMEEIRQLIYENKEVEVALQCAKYLFVGALVNGMGGQALRIISKDNNVRIDSDLLGVGGDAPAAPAQAAQPAGDKARASGAQAAGQKAKPPAAPEASASPQPSSSSSTAAPIYQVRIRGQNSKVLAARAQLESLLKTYQEDTCTMCISDSIFPVLMGKQGATIKALREKYPDVQIDVHGLDVHVHSTDHELRDQVEAEIMNLINTNYSATVEIADEANFNLLSKLRYYSQHLKPLCTQLGVNVYFLRKSLQVKLRGPQAEVEQMKERFASYLASLHSQDVNIDAEDFNIFVKPVPFLAVKTAESQPATTSPVSFSINAPGQADDEDEPDTEGQGNLAAADKLAGTGEGGDVAQAKDSAGWSLLRALEHVYDVDIQIDRKASGASAKGASLPALVKVIVRGAATAIAQTAKHFQGILHGESRYHTACVSLPEAIIPAVIGKGGSNVKRLETKHGVLIGYNKNTSCVRVYGHDAAAREQVVHLLRAIIHTHRVTDTLYLTPAGALVDKVEGGSAAEIEGSSGAGASAAARTAPATGDKKPSGRADEARQRKGGNKSASKPNAENAEAPPAADATRTSAPAHATTSASLAVFDAILKRAMDLFKVDIERSPFALASRAGSSGAGGLGWKLVLRGHWPLLQEARHFLSCFYPAQEAVFPPFFQVRLLPELGRKLQQATKLPKNLEIFQNKYQVKLVWNDDTTMMGYVPVAAPGVATSANSQRGSVCPPWPVGLDGRSQVSTLDALHGILERHSIIRQAFVKLMYSLYAPQVAFLEVPRAFVMDAWFFPSPAASASSSGAGSAGSLASVLSLVSGPLGDAGAGEEGEEAVGVTVEWMKGIVVLCGVDMTRAMTLIDAALENWKSTHVLIPLSSTPASSSSSPSSLCLDIWQDKGTVPALAALLNGWSDVVWSLDRHSKVLSLSLAPPSAAGAKEDRNSAKSKASSRTPATTAAATNAPPQEIEEGEIVEGADAAADSAPAASGPTSLQKVVSEVQQLWDRLQRETAIVPLPSVAVLPGLIGKAGAHINAIRTECEVSLDIDDQQLQVKIRGKEAGVKSAVERVLKYLEQEKTNVQVVRSAVLHSTTVIPFLIGTKGTRIRTIEESCEVRIDIDKNRKRINIKGREGACDKALQEINAAFETEGLLTLSFQPVTSGPSSEDEAEENAAAATSAYPSVAVGSAAVAASAAGPSPGHVLSKSSMRRLRRKQASAQEVSAKELEADGDEKDAQPPIEPEPEPEAPVPVATSAAPATAKPAAVVPPERDARVVEDEPPRLVQERVVPVAPVRPTPDASLAVGTKPAAQAPVSTPAPVPVVAPAPRAAPAPGPVAPPSALAQPSSVLSFAEPAGASPVLPIGSRLLSRAPAQPSSLPAAPGLPTPTSSYKQSDLLALLLGNGSGPTSSSSSSTSTTATFSVASASHSLPTGSSTSGAGGYAQYSQFGGQATTFVPEALSANTSSSHASALPNPSAPRHALPPGLGGDATAAQGAKPSAANYYKSKSGLTVRL